MPLSLDDEAMEAVMTLAQPLAPSERGAFLRALADALAPYPAETIGPGLIHRVGAPVQRRFMAYPHGRLSGPTPRRDAVTRQAGKPT